MTNSKKGSSNGQTAVSPSATELERAWDSLSLDVASAVYRCQQPTPHDEDPLRYFAIEGEGTDHRRDKLPTLREIDPLRYDLVPHT